MSEQRKVELISKIMELSYEVTRDTISDVHVEFSGHVNKICFWVYEKGYNQKTMTGKIDDAINEEIDLYLESDNAERKLKEILSKLEELKTNTRIEEIANDPTIF